jgi:hypothetical protein
MRPGANAARSTYRKYQPKNTAPAGTTKDPRRRRRVRNSRLA